MLRKREKELLEAVNQGLTTAEIAVKFYLRMDTVEIYRRNIILKMKAENIFDAVAKARQMGIIE